ncbi:c-type cytochrome [Phenylobacterium deserti]|uniref:Cytochrome c n=1 Tax=Phenylobacterium deserti TaxID=1914756 RepID=A0A328A984_9CAUL|nr:cytochrome c [Phenylobacterium deserti]RAK50696.1 cytochrome c [Phenylobacterium deserti]
MGWTSGRRVAVAAALFIGAAVAGGGALAQAGGAGAKAVVARQNNFKQLGQANKALSDELKKGSPDKGVITANAQKVASLSAQVPTWFPKGSGPEAGVKTNAKPEVWSDAAGFSAAANRAGAEAAKLRQVSLGGDFDAIRAQARATGAACKGCHDKYRVPEKR